MQIKFRDGSTNTATVYDPEAKKEGLFICMPALGVRASYYEPFALSLAEQGYTVITIDWRGAGNSDLRASRKTDFAYKDLIADLKEWTDRITAAFPGKKRILIGHSLGGQIGSLFASRYSGALHGIVLITSCTVYYKSWDGNNRFKVWLAGKWFYPLSKLVGYFPGNAVAFGGREAKSVMKDWCINAMSGKYDHVDKNHNYEESLHAMNLPVLALSIANDWLAPEKAVRHLFEKFSKESPVSYMQISAESSGIPGLDHFNWVKKPGYFVKTATDWFNNL